MGLLDLLGILANESEDRSEYPCMRCRAPMHKADDEVLVCDKCGYSVDIEDWISDPELFDSEVTHLTKYDDPAYEEYGEDYDEVFGED